MKTHKLFIIAYLIGLSIITILLCVSLATPAWAVRDIGRTGGKDYVQIHYGLFQKCVWTKFNDTNECVNTWAAALPWRQACVALITLSIITCAFSIFWSILVLFNRSPWKGDCHCSICTRPLKPCSKSSLLMPIMAAVAFLFLIVMMSIWGVSTSSFTYYNDYSMYSAVAALTLLLVCTFLGAGVAYFTPTMHRMVPPQSV